MKIYCATNSLSSIPASKLVNIIGKYLYSHIHNAQRYTKTGNSYELYIALIQQDEDSNEAPKKLMVSLNITTYQNKLRINLIAHTPSEETLGYALFNPSNFDSLDDAREQILRSMNKMLQSAYSKAVTLI